MKTPLTELEKLIIQHDMDYHIECLISLAKEAGMVVEIRLESKKPLAMGNFEMVPYIRPARGNY